MYQSLEAGFEAQTNDTFKKYRELRNPKENWNQCFKIYKIFPCVFEKYFCKACKTGVFPLCLGGVIYNPDSKAKVAFEWVSDPQ